MKEEIKVGIADYKVTKSPNRLITLGLGSCVGIAIYDKYTSYGGLCHIMLPDSTQFQNIKKKEKFPDLAIPAMVQELIQLGSKPNRLVAKIAGGASMFQFSDQSLMMNIGARNIEAVRKNLKNLRIPILAEDVGGSTGRTMILDLKELNVYIKTVGKNKKIL